MLDAAAERAQGYARQKRWDAENRDVRGRAARPRYDLDVTREDRLTITALGEIRTDSSIEDAVWPAGTIMGFAGATPPASWLLCTGLLVPQATWPALYAVY